MTQGPIEKALYRDLKALPAELREGGIAATALDLARQLDDPLADVSPRDRTGYVREIRLALVTLREQAPGKVEGDKTEEKIAAREKRLRLVSE